MNLSDIQVELSHPLKKFIQKRWSSLKSRMSHLKASFSNWRIIIISKYGTQLLLIKTNQLNNSESRKTNSGKVLVVL